MRLFIQESNSGSILSLVLFVPGYCNALMKLGYKDAMAKEQEIRQFFNVDNL